ncbi:flavoprotein-like protein [Xylariaceae sp. FL0662B]|nr:flavoprotein-like protein [Xylariaceae sp. FL0662B]
MAPKIAIVFYSMYGHVRQLAEAEKKGIEKAGGTADLFQIPETLSKDVLEKMNAPAQPSEIPLLDDPSTLEAYDGFLFGIPTRYGNFPAQWKAFWDSTGQQWAAGGFWGKMAGLFVSTGTLGGGQESTALAAMSTLTHHGIIYVPFGYAKAFADLVDFSEIHGGSAWGAGTFAGPDGSRQPSDRELRIAATQGEAFYNTKKEAARGEKEAPELPASQPAQRSNGAGTNGASKGASKAHKENSEGPCGLPEKCVVL